MSKYKFEILLYTVKSKIQSQEVLVSPTYHDPDKMSENILKMK
jgi:hypothetical protein